jgi:hypothetical protein
MYLVWKVTRTDVLSAALGDSRFCSLNFTPDIWSSPQFETIYCLQDITPLITCNIVAVFTLYSAASLMLIVQPILLLARFPHLHICNIFIFFSSPHKVTLQLNSDVSSPPYQFLFHSVLYQSISYRRYCNCLHNVKNCPLLFTVHVHYIHRFPYTETLGILYILTVYLLLYRLHLRKCWII